LSELTEYAKAIARASSATLLRSTLNKQTKSDPTAQANVDHATAVSWEAPPRRHNESDDS